MPVHNNRKLNRRIYFGERLFARPLILFIMALIAGIMTAHTKSLLIYPLIFTILGLVLIAIPTVKSTPMFGVYLIYIALLPIFFCIGYFRYHDTESTSELKVKLDRSSECYARGIVTKVTTSYDSFTVTLKDVTVTLLSQNNKDKPTASYVSDGITVTSRTYEALPPLDEIPLPGTIISAKGYIYPCLPPTNPGQFDESSYYLIRGIDARMYSEYIIRSDRIINPITVLSSLLYEVRYYMISNLLQTFNKKESGILCAMLTGERTIMDSETKELFKEGSISHILSISGLHISLLGLGLYSILLKKTGRLSLSIYSTIVVMLLYGLLTGFSVSTKRAILMLSVSLIAKRLGKIYDTLSATSLSAFIILIVSPHSLYDQGFVLSYAAVVGVALGSEVLEAVGVKKYSNSSIKVSLKEHFKREYREKLCMMVFLSLFLMPFLLAFYYELNIYTIAVNLIVLPLMSTVLASGFFAMLIPIPSISGFIGGAAYYILKLYEKICLIVGRLPGSSIITGYPGTAKISFYCCVLIGISVILIYTRKKYVSILLILPAFIFINFDNPAFSADFLDVGQGDCIVLDIDNESIMIDGGSSTVSNVGKYRITPYLKYRGITRLSKVFITHTDSDHTNGIIELIESGYPKIDTLIVSTHIPYESEIIQKAISAGIAIRFAEAGTKLHDKIEVLGPYTDFPYNDINSSSLVLSVEQGNFHMLLTGDMDIFSEIPILQSLYNEVKVNGAYDVLKVAHHGSSSSTSNDLLKIVRPKLSVISCAKYNYYGHPSKDTLNRLNEAGSNILTTPEFGRIGITLSRNNLMVISTGP